MRGIVRCNTAEINLLARSQHRLTIRRLDQTVVGDLRCEHQHATAVGAQDGTGLDIHSTTVSAFEGRITLVAIVRREDTVVDGLLGHVQRGRDQGVHVHLRTAPEQDAVGVDQIHLTVGIEVTEDAAGIGAENLVDGDRILARRRKVTVLPALMLNESQFSTTLSSR